MNTINEIPTRYSPKDTEDKWYSFWEENALFAAKSNPQKKPFCIVIPPPNVTGILHMGHALNNTIQDILIRYHRMKGEESLWMPGIDHAGIATQNVVEKAIAKEGLKRQDLGREKFIERVWQWKEQYGSTIIKQLRKLGASCDWSRIRFTMDEEYSLAVKSVFTSLWEKGLIYQDAKVINWCPRCQTALSDEEAPHHELQGNLYYLKYPLKEEIRNKTSRQKSRDPDILSGQIQDSESQDYIVVATTRPETMLGDTAVAVNPKDKRFKKLIGKTLVLPLVNKEIKIIGDSMVDMKFGTGAVKVTPSHDPNDYALGKKHHLEFINVMSPDGRMNENSGEYKDMDRFEAREVILEDLKEKGLLEKIEPHKLSAGHCYRCHTIIEPYLSRQWFVKMGHLAGPAIEAVKKGRIKFYPKRWTRVYLNWMENIQDWCISRQIWWGHRLPIYYCKNCLKQANECKVKSVKCKENLLYEKGIFVSRSKPEKCPECGSTDIYQDEDVLDTWFSSWLWPFATFGWPFERQSAERKAHSEKELNYFYPTFVLSTAPEIIFFWVARMIMAGMEFMGDIPFKDVYIHGTVRDIEGKKMSKSLGNIIDPLDIINKYGTDALRFSLISITAQGQDVFLTKERFEQGRNFANKIWNASRFILMNLELSAVKNVSCNFFTNKEKGELDIINRWILSRFYSVVKETNRYLDSYKFNEAANLLYSFFWHEFCDWYLELVKPILSVGAGLVPARNNVGTGHDLSGINNKHQTQIILYTVLEQFLRILHPFMPFISEEIWQSLKPQLSGVQSIMVQPWPEVQEQIIDRKVEKQAQTIFALITQIRNLRSSIEIKPEEKVKVSLYPHAKIKHKLIKDNTGLIINLAKLADLELLDINQRPKAAISAIVEDIDTYLHFSGLLDIALEQKKIKEKMSSLTKMISSKQSRLNNPDFAKKAPKEIIEKEKESCLKLTDELKRLEKMYDELS